MNTPAYVRIADLPTVLRFKRGHNSFRDVADVADLSASAMSRLERGEGEPTLETLEKLASYLDRPILIEP